MLRRVQFDPARPTLPEIQVDARTKRGFLRKKSGFFGQYQRFFVVLERSALSIFNLPSDRVPTFTIPLEGSSVVVADHLIGKPHALAIFPSPSAPQKNTYAGAPVHLVAESDEERDEWLKYLSGAPSAHSQEDGMVQMIEAMLDSVVVSDAQGKIVALNRAAETMFGWTAQEAVGQSVTVLMPQSVATHHHGFVENYSRTKKGNLLGKPRKVVCRRKDGTYVPAEISLGEMPNEWKGAHFIAVFREVDSVDDQELQAVGGHCACSHDSKITGEFGENQKFELSETCGEDPVTLDSDAQTFDAMMRLFAQQMKDASYCSQSKMDQLETLCALAEQSKKRTQELEFENRQLKECLNKRTETIFLLHKKLATTTTPEKSLVPTPPVGDPPVTPRRHSLTKCPAPELGEKDILAGPSLSNPSSQTTTTATESSQTSALSGSLATSLLEDQIKTIHNLLSKLFNFQFFQKRIQTTISVNNNSSSIIIGESDITHHHHHHQQQSASLLADLLRYDIQVLNQLCKSFEASPLEAPEPQPCSRDLSSSFNSNTTKLQSPRNLAQSPTPRKQRARSASLGTRVTELNERELKKAMVVATFHILMHKSKLKQIQEAVRANEVGARNPAVLSILERLEERRNRVLDRWTRRRSIVKIYKEQRPRAVMNEQLWGTSFSRRQAALLSQDFPASTSLPDEKHTTTGCFFPPLVVGGPSSSATHLNSSMSADSLDSRGIAIPKTSARRSSNPIGGVYSDPINIPSPRRSTIAMPAPQPQNDHSPKMGTSPRIPRFIRERDASNALFSSSRAEVYRVPRPPPP